MGKLRIKWREFWWLEALELVGGKYLSWVRILTKSQKKRGLGSVEREGWWECWSCREPERGCWSCWSCNQVL